MRDDASGVPTEDGNINPLASPGDMDIPRCVRGADEAIALIREAHGRWRGGRS